MDRVDYNLDSLTLNSTELDGYSCCRVAIAIVINNDAEQIDRRREHENQPQQRPTQIFLDVSHQFSSSGKEHPLDDYTVTSGD